MSNPLSQREVLITFLDCTHTIWSANAARRMAEPFGVTPALEIYADCRGEFKGTVLNTGPNSKCVGLDTLLLARQISRKFGLTVEAYHGRGSQVRAFVFAIAAHLHISLQRCLFCEMEPCACGRDDAANPT